MLTAIHPPRHWPALRRAGACAASTLAGLADQIRPGVTPRQLDAWVRRDTAARGGRPSQLGYNGFSGAVCISVNDVVCHGIPGDVPLREGDIVNCDVTTELDGFHGDTSRTFLVGEVSPLAKRVVEVALGALNAGIAACRPDGRLGDIGLAVEGYVRTAGHSVVRDFGGHGIGRRMHLPPHVHHHARTQRGPFLRPGMAFTIEPMVNQFRPEVRVAEDGWTVHTADGGLSAQFEHTLLITPEGIEILTPWPA